MRKLALFLLLTSVIFARNVVSTTSEIQSAANDGCYARTGDPSSIATITTSTVYDTFSTGSDCNYDYFNTTYDSEIDRVTAVTDCTVTQHVELNTTISDGVATISHINFTCATNCSTPVAPDGTTYQYTTASQSECNVNTLQSLLDQENPSSPYKVSAAQWVNCFDSSASELNGCYVFLELKSSPEDNNTDSNGTSNPDSNNSNNGTINTSQIEQLLSEIHTDTTHIADDTYWLKNSFDEFIKEGNSSQLVDYYGQFSDQDINQSKKDFSDLLSSAGLDFNESNGSVFDTYKSAIDGFHGELYSDLLDDNSSYSIKGLFASALSEITTIGSDANPVVLFVEKGSNITFPPIVLDYQNPTLSWLRFQITITSDDLFAGKMAPFWSMIRLFLIFFAVWYGFMILIRGL